MTPEVKAAGFNSFLELTRQTVGQAAFDGMVAGLPPELADYIRRPRLAPTWLPMKDASAIQERVWQELLGGNAERIFELARRQLIADMSTVYKFFLKFGSPGLVARRAPAIYGTFVRNAGEMRLVRDEDRLVELEVVRHPFPSPAFWESMRGNIHGTADATRAPHARTSIVDGGGASPSGRIRLTWG
jgi:hypothetical protein